MKLLLLYELNLKILKNYFESKAKSGFGLLIDTGLCLEKTDLTCCGENILKGMPDRKCEASSFKGFGTKSPICFKFWSDDLWDSRN